MKRWIILIIVLILFVIGGISLVKLRKKQLESIRIAPLRAVPVETARAHVGKYIHWQPYIGHLESNRQGTVRARIAGQVSRILKREGDRVRKGDPVIELDGVPGDAIGSRAALEAALKNTKQSVRDLQQAEENMRTIYGRDKMLFEKAVISRQAMEVSENRWKAAKVQLQAVKSQLADIQSKLSFFSVKAPFDGVVSGVKVNEGDVVMVSQPLMELEDATPCKIKTTVSTDDIPKLGKGDPAELQYGGQKMDARVSRVYPSARDTGVGTVEVDCPRPPFGLPLGATITVMLPIQRIESALILPPGSVLTAVDKSTVFKVVAGKVKVVPVTVLGQSENGFAVSGRLEAGDTVVTGSDSLLMRLSDGMAVKRVEEIK